MSKASGQQDRPSQFGQWLHDELARRGLLERGGRMRFARESGIHLSIISRVLNEGRAPEIDALRGFGKALGYTLGEMLVVAGIAHADELPVRASLGATNAPTPNAFAPLSGALSDLRAAAALEGKTVGEMLVEGGLAAREELIVPSALPQDPVIVEIEASDISEETKANLIRMHLDNRARHFEAARLEHQRNRKKPGG